MLTVEAGEDKLIQKLRGEGVQESNARAWFWLSYDIKKKKSSAGKKCFVTLVQPIHFQACTPKSLTASMPNYTQKNNS